MLNLHFKCSNRENEILEDLQRKRESRMHTHTHIQNMRIHIHFVTI